jgi:hypothetical protein
MATLNPGALYELVARGVKDTYISTSASAGSGKYINPYSQAQPPVQPIIKEARYTQAKSLQPLEFDLDVFGDILKSLRFKVTLPSWYPSELPIMTNEYISSDTVAKMRTITDLSGNTYSYSPYAAYFLFKKITLYQDNQIVYSIDGDGLYALTRETASTAGLSAAWLSDRVAGQYPQMGVPLWVTVPFPGTSAVDTGFPLCALFTGQQFRIRCELRDIDELIYCSDPSGGLPWNKQLTYETLDGIHTFQATEKQGRSLIELENTQIYLDNDARDAFSAMEHRIIYKRPFKNTWEMGLREYEPLVRGAAESIIVRQIDGRHPTNEIVIMTRSLYWIRRNIYTAEPLTYYNSVRMTIGGQEREAAQNELILGEVNNFLRKDIYRMNDSQAIIRFNWTIIDDSNVGTVNFTTAIKPAIHFSLAVIDTQYMDSVQDIYVIGNAVYEIKNGRGHIVFYN